ncbi:hypothetical protein BH24DEI2_BH24DEI2_20830 [soil metagenome]
MSTVHFKLDDTLRRHKKTASALVEASGLAKATVYNIVNNKAKAVELGTLSKLIKGLHKLTGEEATINDILEKESQPDWREEILKNAKPFDWDAMMADIPDWTEEEKVENEEFVKILEEQRKIDRELSLEREKRLLALFEEEAEPTS